MCTCVLPELSRNTNPFFGSPRFYRIFWLQKLAQPSNRELFSEPPVVSARKGWRGWLRIIFSLYLGRKQVLLRVYFNILWFYCIEREVMMMDLQYFHTKRKQEKHALHASPASLGWLNWPFLTSSYPLTFLTYLEPRLILRSSPSLVE